MVTLVGAGLCKSALQRWRSTARFPPVGVPPVHRGCTQRHQAFYQSARPILRHWNIVHIVLAIAMFILAGIHIVYGFIYKAV